MKNINEINAIFEGTGTANHEEAITLCDKFIESIKPQENWNCISLFLKNIDNFATEYCNKIETYRNNAFDENEEEIRKKLIPMYTIVTRLYEYLLSFNYKNTLDSLLKLAQHTGKDRPLNYVYIILGNVYSAQKNKSHAVYWYEKATRYPKNGLQAAFYALHRLKEFYKEVTNYNIDDYLEKILKSSSKFKFTYQSQWDFEVSERLKKLKELGVNNIEIKPELPSILSLKTKKIKAIIKNITLGENAEEEKKYSEALSYYQEEKATFCIEDLLWKLLKEKSVVEIDTKFDPEMPLPSLPFFLLEKNKKKHLISATLYLTKMIEFCGKKKNLVNFHSQEFFWEKIRLAAFELGKTPNAFSLYEDLIHQGDEVSLNIVTIHAKRNKNEGCINSARYIMGKLHWLKKDEKLARYWFEKTFRYPDENSPKTLEKLIELLKDTLTDPDSEWPVFIAEQYDRLGKNLEAKKILFDAIKIGNKHAFKKLQEYKNVGYLKVYIYANGYKVVEPDIPYAIEECYKILMSYYDISSNLKKITNDYYEKNKDSKMHTLFDDNFKNFKNEINARDYNKNFEYGIELLEQFTLQGYVKAIYYLADIYQKGLYPTSPEKDVSFRITQSLYFQALDIENEQKIEKSQSREKIDNLYLLGPTLENFSILNFVDFNKWLKNKKLKDKTPYYICAIEDYYQQFGNIKESIILDMFQKLKDIKFFPLSSIFSNSEKNLNDFINKYENILSNKITKEL